MHPLLVRLTAGIALTASLTTGCVSLNSVSLTQIPKERSNKVSAESSRFMFLGLNFDNDYVDDVRDTLKSKCKGGRITGILTKDESINYFLFIFWRRRVEAQGFCIK